MSDEPSPKAKRLMALEEHAHRIRMDLLGRPGLIERLQSAREAIERGEWITLEEFEAELARLDDLDRS